VHRIELTAGGIGGRPIGRDGPGSRSGTNIANLARIELSLCRSVVHLGVVVAQDSHRIPTIPGLSQVLVLSGPRDCVAVLLKGCRSLIYLITSQGNGGRFRQHAALSIDIAVVVPQERLTCILAPLFLDLAELDKLHFRLCRMGNLFGQQGRIQTLSLSRYSPQLSGHRYYLLSGAAFLRMLS